MFFAKVCITLTLALSAAAVSTPHMARNMAVHHAMAAREPIAEAEAAPAIVPVARRLAKRGNVRRCKANNGTLPSPSPSSSSVVLPTPTPPKPPVAPVNPAPAPPSFSSSSVAARPTHSSHSVAEPPASTSSSSPAAPPPPPKTSHTPPPAKPTPPPTQGSASGSGSGSIDPSVAGTHSGDATYYGTGLGACGITNHDTDLIAAVSHLLFDTFPGYQGGNPNNNPICGQKIKAQYGGNEVTITVTDRCVGCDKWDLDFSPTAFTKLADQALGRLHDMTWNFI